MACPVASNPLAFNLLFTVAALSAAFAALSFTPNLVYNLHDDPRIYLLNSINGIVLISLCNGFLQDLVEEPFDQMGLDDIKLDEFEFLEPGPREHAVPVNA